MENIKLEICVASAKGAINAFEAGADRVELNSSIAYGGLTPSIATIKKVKNEIDIPLLVMIRPRGGGFCYSDIEFELMKEDLRKAIEAGADGVVFGILKRDAKVDYKRNKILVDIAKPATTVFHRAFDVVPEPFKAMRKVIDIGFDRILTSAQSNKIENNLSLAKKLIDYSRGNIEILLCGGIRERNINNIIGTTNCNQIHLAAFKEKTDTSMTNKNIKFNKPCISENKYLITDKNMVKKIKEIIE